jgi:desulfoferrodoxin (superoxide reductase-like protein)
MFAFAIRSLNETDETNKELALRCMCLSAQKGNRYAMEYCNLHNIKYNKK